MEGPFYYVFNTLLEKPDADITTLVAEYCQAAFGPAAARMISFYDRLNLQLQTTSLVDEGWSMAAGSDLGSYGTTYARRGTSLPMLGYIYSPDAVKSMEASLTHAEKTPGLTEKMKRRLALVRLEWTYAKNLGKIANLYAAYKTVPTKDSFALLADAIRERNAFLDDLYAKGPERPKKIEGWSELMTFGGFGRKMLSTNGRLSAALSAPLNWDVDFLQSIGMLPGAAAKSMKAAKAAERPSTTDFESGAWAKAAWQDLGGSGMQKLDRTARAKVLYDDEALHVAIESDLDDDVVVRRMGHDGSIWTDECAEVLVDPTGSREVFYHFIAGPDEGALYDEAFGLITDPLDPKFRKRDADWNAKGVTTANRRQNGRWTAYLRIPYADLNASKPAAGDVWGVNFCRTWDFARGAEKCFSGYWNPNLESGSFVSPEAMGLLVFE